MLSRHELLRSFRIIFSRPRVGREQCPCHTIRMKSRFAYPEGMSAYEDDYTEKPEYPSIIPELRGLGERQLKRMKKVQDWHNDIRNAKTVEEKQIQLNIIRRYGWRSHILDEKYFAYDCTPLYAFITRTHFVPDYKLPDIYSDPDLSQRAKRIVEKLREPLLELLRFEFDGVERTLNPTELETDTVMACEKTTSIVNQVNRLLISALADTVPHLKTCQVDYKPHVEAFWCCGGLERTKRQQDAAEGRKKRVEKLGLVFSEGVDGPTERNFQYLGTPILQIRSINPILNFVEADSELCQRGESIPDRHREGLAPFQRSRRDYRFATMIPGYWSGDDHRSSLLAIHSQDHLNLSTRQSEYWKNDHSSALDSQAIVASFSRLVAQAYYYGFDQFSDLNYPFSTQFISTNGLQWSFYTYQLNTMKLINTEIAKNKRQNICWGTKPMNILVDDKLNEEVVENLVKFYLQPPARMSIPKEEITPYLSQQQLDDYDDDYRNFVYENLMDMYCGKKLDPAETPFPEVHHWELIYKIYFKTMPIEPLRRHFELPRGFPGSDPYNELYTLRNPKRSTPKALYRYRRELKEKKEQDALIAAKEAERDMFKNKPKEDDRIL